MRYELFLWVDSPVDTAVVFFWCGCRLDALQQITTNNRHRLGVAREIFLSTSDLNQSLQYPAQAEGLQACS